MVDFKPEDFGVEDCKVCGDIHDWVEKVKHSAFDKKTEKEEVAKEVDDTFWKPYPEAPDSIELGQSTWGFLHVMSVYYPENPSSEDKKDMEIFFQKFSKFYPCRPCAEHLQMELKSNPPKTSSRDALSDWVCQLHNKVNERLGKPLFDCKDVYKRWRG